MNSPPKTKKRLNTARELTRVITEYYTRCVEAKTKKIPVGWMPPMNGAIELFYAMDLQPVFPENWSPVCAAFGLSPQNFTVSENMGYSRDLCGYLRNIIGYVHGPMSDRNSPFGGLPEPDLLLTPFGGCVPVMKIFQALERRFPRAKVYSGDLPQTAVEEIGESHIEYAVSEMNRLIDFLETETGRTLDMDRLAETVALSDKACALWDEIMSFRKCVPVPFSAAEMGIMFVMVTLQGTDVAVDYLGRVRDEVRSRAEAGIGVIEDEKLRLFWDNIPLWYNMALFNYFEPAGGVFVAETYSAAWSIRMDTSDPIRALAIKSLMSYPLVSCVSISRRKEMVLKACRDYAIDGVIFHRNKSCLPITLGQMEIRRALEEELGIPSVFIDADHMDERNFSMAQFQTRADAFIEMLLERKHRA